MPAFGEVLSRDEIIAVLEYVKGLWGDKTAEGLGLEKQKFQAVALHDESELKRKNHFLHNE